ARASLAMQWRIDTAWAGLVPTHDECLPTGCGGCTRHRPATAIMRPGSAAAGIHESTSLVLPFPDAGRRGRLLRADRLCHLQPVLLGAGAVSAVHLPAHRLRGAGPGDAAGRAARARRGWRPQHVERAEP